MILVHKIGIRRIPYKKCLGISNKIGSKARGGSSEKKYYVVQFGDVNFYRFLLSIGLKPKKSKILGALGIEKKYFADFFRGCIDGDGSINTFQHPESVLPQLRLTLCSASMPFLKWMKEKCQSVTSVRGGWIGYQSSNGVWVLAYGKADTKILSRFMYYPGVEYYLQRKYKKVKVFLGE